MGTITMSGFNNIDWNQVLNAVMQQESQPLTTMQARYSELQTRSSAYGTLATKLAALQSAATDLKTSGLVSGRTTSSTDATAVAITAGSTAMVGTYDVVVTSLARAQVTTAATTFGSKDTVIATGGKLVINGKDVALTGDTTLQQLADAINNTDDLGAKATIVQAAGQFQLVLTGTDTGASHAFTATSQLEGSTFDFSSTNAIDATDADVTINNVRITSATNAITDAIPGATVTLLRKPATTTVLTVAEDASETKTRLQTFVTKYNDLVSFFKQQAEATKGGSVGSLGTDSLMRALRGQLSSAVLGTVNVGGEFGNLAEIGLEFERDGTLSLDASLFDDKSKANQADLEKLLAGTSTVDGAFDAIASAIADYAQSGGLVPDAQTRLTEQMQQLSERMADEQSRLAVRRATLQREYAAADQAMSTLNAQGSSLANLNSGYRLY